MADADRDAPATRGFLTLGRRFFGVAHDIVSVAVGSGQRLIRDMELPVETYKLEKLERSD